MTRNTDRAPAADSRDTRVTPELLAQRLEDLRMAWTIGACFGKEHHRWTADDYRGRSLSMSANTCLGLTEDGQSSIPEGM